MSDRLMMKVALLVVALLVAESCATMTDPALKTRATAYLQVANDMSKVKDFLTPRISGFLSGVVGSKVAMMAFPSVPQELQSASDSELATIPLDEIQVRTIRKWGQVRFQMETATGVHSFDTIWVKVEGEWYLFGGTDGEYSEYGKPPVFVE